MGWFLFALVGFSAGYLLCGFLMDNAPLISDCDCDGPCSRMDCDSMLDFDEVEKEETVVDV